MNIVQVGPYPPPYGGMPVHVRQLHQHLKSLGYRSNVINTWLHLTKDDYVVSLKGGKIIKHIHLLFTLIGSSCDLVHIHSTANNSFFGKSISIWALRLLHRKCIVSIHGGDFQRFIVENRQTLKYFIRLTLGLAGSVIVVNAKHKADLISLGVPEEKVVVIGPFLPAYAEEKESMPDEVESFLKYHNPIICFVGALKPEYGFELLMESVSRLKERHPNLGLVALISAAGVEDTELSSSIQSKIEEHNIDKNILFCYNVPYVMQVMQRSDVFVRPSYFDGDAISVREALSLGVPTVASDTDFRPQGVTLFQIGDEQHLYRKLVCVLENPQDHKNVSDHSAEANLRDMLDLYSTCCDCS